MEAGKPRDQALAIAYAIKRKNRKAMGGMIEPKEALQQAADYELSKEDLVKENEPDMDGEQTGQPVEMKYYASDPRAQNMMARGGMIAKAIMAKKYADGGIVSEGESEIHETPGHLMEDGEHEVEGMGEKEDIMKKGLMARILGDIRLKNMGR